MRSDARSSFFRKCVFDVDMLEREGEGKKRVTLIARFIVSASFFVSRHSPLCVRLLFLYPLLPFP